MTATKQAHYSETIPLVTTMLVGTIIVAVCQWFSVYDRVQDLHFFNLFGWENRRWSIGRRELVHLIGFIGCILFGWSFARSMSIERLRVMYGLVALLATAYVHLATSAPSAIRFEIWGSDTPARVVIAIDCFLVVVMMGLLAAWLTPRLLNHREALQITVIVTLAISLGWEFICQPMFGTFRASDRTGLDAAQILCDLLGIGLGVLVTRHFQARLKKGN